MVLQLGGCAGGELTGERTARYEVLHRASDLYGFFAMTQATFSPKIIKVIKARRMIWAGHGRDEKGKQNFHRKT
jgi:hypothetical protein